MSYQQLPFDVSSLEALDNGGIVGAIKSDFKYPYKKTFDFLSSCWKKAKKAICNKSSKINLQSINENKHSSVYR